MVKNCILAAAVGGIVSAGLVVASAHADPLSNPDEHCYSTTFAVYCDGPIQPDGTWTRSWTSYGESYYAGPGQMGFIPTTTHYQHIDPTQPWPAFPLGAPQHHIDVTEGGL